MAGYVVLLVALALAPGLQSAVVETDEEPIFQTRPLLLKTQEETVPEVENETNPLPESEIETRPLPLPESEVETRPLPLPEPEVETRPLPLPQPLPEVETRPLPLPEPIPEVEAETNPCAACFAYMSSLIEDLAVLVPETEDTPQIETRPLTEAEAEEELAKQNVPLPTYIIR